MQNRAWLLHINRLLLQQQFLCRSKGQGFPGRSESRARRFSISFNWNSRVSTAPCRANADSFFASWALFVR